MIPKNCFSVSLLTPVVPFSEYKNLFEQNGSRTEIPIVNACQFDNNALHLCVTLELVQSNHSKSMEE